MCGVIFTQLLSQSAGGRHEPGDNKIFQVWNTDIPIFCFPLFSSSQHPFSTTAGTVIISRNKFLIVSISIWSIYLWAHIWVFIFFSDFLTATASYYTSTWRYCVRYSCFIWFGNYFLSKFYEVFSKIYTHMELKIFKEYTYICVYVCMFACIIYSLYMCVYLYIQIYVYVSIWSLMHGNEFYNDVQTYMSSSTYTLLSSPLPI